MSTGGAPACASAPDCAVSEVGNAIVAIMSLVTAQPLSSAAADATNKRRRQGRPPYRLLHPSKVPAAQSGTGCARRRLAT